MSSGAGVGPAGTMPAGGAVPDTVAAPPPASTLRRWIDPITGQYALNATTGGFEQMPAIRQRVMLAIGTARGSSTSNPTLGKTRPGIMGSKFDEEEKQFVRTALRQLTDVEQVITIVDIKVVRATQPGRWRTTVGYVEVGTNQYHEDNFG